MGEWMRWCLQWEVTIPALSTKWAYSRYSVSVFPPLFPSELSIGYDRNLRFGSLCGRWEAVFTDPGIQG